ncbi:MAG TPA: quinone-dependent dihydroorotate dehydrogenase [Gammaproteobacteria bacterium]|jgi:dihydroorotate dehydrogenase|nr:quinone-dependent dihydroorotate dehydrogenase [Gammaproteobacteria bacterium]
MNLFNILKNGLFSLDPEHAHEIALKGMQLAYRTRTSGLFGAQKFTKPCKLMGLEFSSPVGLAAGFDKNADYVDALAALGFGFIEVGTLTPKPQAGNPKPRLFRLAEQQAIINRMGFNNKGIEHAAKRLEKINYRGVLGINLGKNADTPLENAVDDYLTGFRALWKYASYITINISSPNTRGLRDLQQKVFLSSILRTMKEEQTKILQREKKYVPLVIKLSPDMTDEQTEEGAKIILEEKIDGVIATNTTVSRDGVLESKYVNETGGLSGMPLCGRSTHVIKKLASILKDEIPVFGSGGVMDEETAKDKLNAGARLIQVYTGFIYHGPEIISRIAKVF